MKWLKYSGMSVCFTVNPLHWRLLPVVRGVPNEWKGPHEYTGEVAWLFLTLRVWIDDGSW